MKVFMWVCVFSSINSFSFGQSNILIVHKPGHPLKELVNGTAAANFDFMIEHGSKDTVTLTKIEAVFFDKDSHILQEKFLDNNGTAPSLQTINAIRWNGVSRSTIFNPFPELKYEEIYRLLYKFTFTDKEGNIFTETDTVLPEEYKQPVNFILPLKNRILVYDGQDFYSHHRRFDTEHPVIKELGFTSNMMRYAFDLVVLDSNNHKYSEDGKTDQEWFGFGAEVRAVADGIVEEVVTDQPDNKTFNIPGLKQNPLALFGNYVVIRHEDSLFSVYGHLKQFSSSSLNRGDKIKQGQTIGAIGTSGSAFIPHLHFEVQNGIHHGAEGLPSYFTDFYLLAGAKRFNQAYSTINTGDILVAH